MFDIMGYASNAYYGSGYRDIHGIAECSQHAAPTAWYTEERIRSKSWDQSCGLSNLTPSLTLCPVALQIQNCSVGHFPDYIERVRNSTLGKAHYSTAHSTA